MRFLRGARIYTASDTGTRLKSYFPPGPEGTATLTDTSIDRMNNIEIMYTKY